MERSEKQLPSKANFSLFCSLIGLILGQNSEEGLSVTKIGKAIKFEGVWHDLESKNVFQRQ